MFSVVFTTLHCWRVCYVWEEAQNPIVSLPGCPRPTGSCNLLRNHVYRVDGRGVPMEGLPVRQGGTLGAREPSTSQLHRRRHGPLHLSVPCPVRVSCCRLMGPRSPSLKDTNLFNKKHGGRVRVTVYCTSSSSALIYLYLYQNTNP